MEEPIDVPAVVEPGETTPLPLRSGKARRRGLATAQYTQYLPERLRERYEEIVNSPDYISLREQIAVLELRLTELLERIERGDSRQRRKDLLVELQRLETDHRLRYFPAELLNELESLTEETLQEASYSPELLELVLARLRQVLLGVQQEEQHLRELCELAAEQRRQDEVWEDLDRFTETLRRLKETEVKRMVAANQVLTVAESYALIQHLVRFLETHVEDLELRARAVRELHSLLERKGVR